MTKKRHRESFEKAVREKKADKLAIPICRFLNLQDEFFSSSSCSGRVVLLNLPATQTKKPGAFYYKKHEKVKAGVIWNKINQETSDELWFKQEPFILHLGTNSLENASRLLAIAKQSGIKRGGIMVAKPGKFLLEFIGTHHISVPVKIEEKVLVTEEFVKALVQRANEKLEQNFMQLKRFEIELKKELKST